MLTTVSVMVLGLLLTGVVGLAGGNDPGDGNCENPMGRDHDGDGVFNCNDEDWTPSEDGSGYGASGEKGQGLGQGKGGYGSGDGTPDGNGLHGNRGLGQGKGRA